MKAKSLLIMAMALLGLNFSSCTSHKPKDRSKMTKFIWQPSIAAPKNYPIEIKYCKVGFGNDGGNIPVMDLDAGHGISEMFGAVDIDEGEGGIDIPNSLDILWASYTEKKFYKAQIKFSPELQNKILQTFRQTFYRRRRISSTAFETKQHCYSNFIVSMLPGGKIWLYLAGLGRVVLVCDNLQAKEVHMTLAEFDSITGEIYKNNINTFSTSCLTDYPGSAENLKEHGIPYNLWGRYAERFRYDIKMDFEDKSIKLEPDFGYEFADGEWYPYHDGINEKMLARLKHTEFGWETKDSIYTGYFYFNEDEMLDIFDKAYDNNKNQQGEFVIKINKYSNWFDISLRVGGKEFPFEKTKIHVFKQGIHQSDIYAVIIYNNHRDINSKNIHYVGE